MLYCATRAVMRDLTEEWAGKVQQSGFGGILGTILDGLKPLGFIGAQFAYMLDPFLSREAAWLHELGQILEDPDELGRLVDRLRGEEGA
jgi:hypothetical protein